MDLSGVNILQRSIGLLNGITDELLANNPINQSVKVGPPFTCLLCQSWYYIGGKLRLHYAVNHGFLDCEICDVVLQDDAQKKEHFSRCHSEIACEVCRIPHPNLQVLFRHYEQEHGFKACEYCAMLVSPVDHYEEHIVKFHRCSNKSYLRNENKQLITLSTNSNTLFMCNFCPQLKTYKGRKEKDNFFGHFKTHHKFTTSLMISLIKSQNLDLSIEGMTVDEREKLSVSLNADPLAPAIDTEAHEEVTKDDSKTDDKQEEEEMVTVKEEPEDSNSEISGYDGESGSESDGMGSFSSETYEDLLEGVEKEVSEEETENEKVKKKRKRKACGVCNRKYTKFVPKYIHSIWCMDEKPCKDCDKTFATESKLKHHVAKSHNLLFTCSQCTEKFETDKSLDEHLYETHDSIECKLCDETILRSKYKVHASKKHKCTEDIVPMWLTKVKDWSILKSEASKNEETTSSPSDDKQEKDPQQKFRLVVPTTNNRRLKCALCKNDLTKDVKELSYLYLHFKRTHRLPLRRFNYLLGCKPTLELDPEDVIFKTKPKRYEINPAEEEDAGKVFEETFQTDVDSDFVYFTYDFENVLGKGQVKCDFCSMEMESKAELSNHLSVTHKLKIKEQPLNCPRCLVMYDSVFHLKKHLYIDHRSDYFICKPCKTEIDFMDARHHLLVNHESEIKEPDTENLLIPCRFCNSKFWTVTELNQHEVDAHLDKNGTECDFLRCSECELLFSVHRSLAEHSKEAHPDGPQYGDFSYACSLCKISYPNAEMIRNHFKQNHDALICYVCPDKTCNNWFRNKMYAKRHFVRIHNNKDKLEERPCELCGKTFRNYTAYTIHKKMKHSDLEKGYKCRICKMILQSLEQRKLHYTTAHPGEDAFRCSECNKGFISKSGLYGHKRIHDIKKTEVCPHCQKEFSRRDSYLEHLLIHTGPKHKCPHCPKTFTQKSNLNRHVRIHTGAKPYSCQYCPKRFSDKGACNSHTRVHVKEERSDCPVCGKSFSQLQKMKYHLRIHTGEGLVSCEICGKTCTNIHSLKEHRARHNTSTQIMCPVCGRCFSMERYLQRHLATVHQICDGTEIKEPKGVGCPSCDMYFPSKKALKEHEKHCIKEYSTQIETVYIKIEPEVPAELPVQCIIKEESPSDKPAKRRRKHTNPVRVTQSTDDNAT